LTIQEYLRRRGSQFASRLAAFLLIAGALVAMFTDIFVLRFACGVVMMTIVVATIISLFQIPCPRCRKSLGPRGFWTASGGVSAKAPHCPHCGVGFGEPTLQADPPGRVTKL
jgi:hypothetical protein